MNRPVDSHTNPRDQITLTGIEAFGYHGVLDHERQYGQRFVVDVALTLDLAPASGSDALADTVDYGALSADVAAIIEGDPVDLIEALAGRIADRCFDDSKVTEVAVTVHKPAAPVPVLVKEVAVTVHRTRA